MSVLLETSKGDIVIDLFTDQCPIASKNFLKLCKTKYYNNSVFFSVEKDFIAQVGDPTNTGMGGESIYGQLYGEQAKYFEDEFVKELKHDRKGVVGYCSNSKNHNASAFYFTLRDSIDYLDGQRTVFGVVAEGLEVLDEINKAFVDDEHRPIQNIRIRHCVILDDPFDDPAGLAVPSRSPSPQRETNPHYLDDNEDFGIDVEGRDPKEVQEELAQKAAKSRAEVLEIIGDIPDADIKPPSNVLFVCKLNEATESEDLAIIFGRFGAIKNCEVIRDWKSGDSLQYAFIEFEDEKACELAYFKMENVLIDDRRIHVDFSQSVAKLWKGYRTGKPESYEGGGGSKGGDKRGGDGGDRRFEIRDRSRREGGDSYGFVFDGGNDGGERGRDGHDRKERKHKKDKKERRGDSRERRHDRERRYDEDRGRSRGDDRRDRDRGRERDRDDRSSRRERESSRDDRRRDDRDYRRRDDRDSGRRRDYR